MSCKSVRKFLRKVANDRQTNRQRNRQTNNDDYISSLAEVTKRVLAQDNDMSSAGAGECSLVNDDDGWSSSRSCHGRMRRLLRSAVRDRDVLTLRRLFASVDVGDLVNAALSDALSSSALAYAARCGYLDVVDALVDLPGCHVDRVDKTRRSALDEAIGAWAAAAAALDGQRQHDCAKRYRIVRRLLAAGTRSLSRQALDLVLSSALDTGSGQHFVRKLVKVKRAPFSLRRVI